MIYFYSMYKFQTAMLSGLIFVLDTMEWWEGIEPAMSQIPVAKPSGGGPPPRPGLSKIATATGQSSVHPHPQNALPITMGKYHKSV